MERTTEDKQQDSRRQKLSAVINVTPAAVAEFRRRLQQEHAEGERLLRISVEAGGCSGLSYEMDFVSEQAETDHVFDFEGLKVLVDRKTLPYINGLTLDYSAKMVNGGFQFSNPVAKRSCGCGTSFSV